MNSFLQILNKVNFIHEFACSRLLSFGQRALCSHTRKLGPSFIKEKGDMYREIIKKELADGANFTSDQWKSLSDKFLQRELKIIGTYVNDSNVDGVILRLCAEFGFSDAGLAYYKFIKARNENIGDGLLSRYLSLCALDKKYCAENEDEIISVYKQLRQSEVVEPLIAERCISVICLYKNHWKDAFYLLEQVKAVGPPTPASYFSIVEACFRFGDIQRGWEILRSIAQTSYAKPNPNVYLSFIEHCNQLKQSGKFKTEHLEELFEFLEEFHISLPNLKVIDKLEKFIFSLSDSKFMWSLKETFVPKSAVCSSCRRVLEPVRISPTEFQELSRHFVRKAVIGRNVFYKSTPGEVESFKHFLVKSHPYDIVIDGLNVAYARGSRSPENLANTLKSVVNHFVRNNKRVLLLGRKHMSSWPVAPMSYIFNNASVFLAMNLSQDDPLLLYAALRGGEKTDFISRDFMRSHLFALEDPRIKLLFRKWLSSHQYRLGYFSHRGVPNIFPPLPYRPTAQKLPLEEPELCWHLPYDEVYLSLPPNKMEPPPKWLCVRRVCRTN